MTEFSSRNMWISIGVVMPLVAIVLFLFRHDEEAREVVKLLGVVVAVFLLKALDTREMRRREHD